MVLTSCFILLQLHPLQTNATPIKHSSSAVDLVACIQPICQLWEKLSWPDPEEAFMLMVKITEVRKIQVLTLFQEYHKSPGAFLQVPSKVSFLQMELKSMHLPVDKNDVMFSNVAME